MLPTEISFNVSLNNIPVQQLTYLLNITSDVKTQLNNLLSTLNSDVQQLCLRLCIHAVITHWNYPSEFFLCSQTNLVCTRASPRTGRPMEKIILVLAR